MKFHKSLGAVLMAATMAQVGALAAGPDFFQVNNRLRLGYDDNVYEQEENTTESFYIAEEPEFLLNLTKPRSFVGLRYRPTFVYWQDREDDTDIHHDLSADFTHDFTPRLSLSMKETFRIASQPEYIDRGTVVREQEDYLYNVVDAALSYLLRPDTRLEAGGRYTLLRYDQDDVAAFEDYDIFAGGLSARHQFSPQLAGSAEYRYEDTQYTDVDDRGAASHFAGLGIENAFGASLVGSVRGGVQFKEFDSDDVDSETAPYVDASLTYLFTPATRLTAGAGYSMTEASVYPYVSQDRFLGYASLAHDFSARLSAYLSGSYSMGQYDGEQRLDGVDAEDGDEVYATLGANVSYRIGLQNWLELGYTFSSLDSDVSQDYDRNRVNLGWRTSL